MLLKNINIIYNSFNQVFLINIQCFDFVYDDSIIINFYSYFNKNNQYIYNYPNEFDNLIKTENSNIYVPFSLIKDDDLN